ncbi:RHS repeat-associated core domain-containing protein [Streptomyces sp. NPDC057620]|uniref:RHS repeat-associated core domain-containing protein n=1 Tax=Streptomyces sp. NPDC057620 TaxID=3346185 RepID=UPI0036B0B79A
MAGYRPTDWHVLDLEKDPTPGDPVRVKSLAKSLHDFADDVQDALRLVNGMAGEDAVLTMVGKTAEVFRDEFSGVPKNLKKLKKSYDLAGDALAAYWPQLERAQTLADKALVKGREAQADLSSAKSKLSSADSWVTRANKEADKYKDDPGSAGKDVPKPDEAKVRAATRDAQSAKDAHTAAQSDVTSAQSALDAAKKMAADARQMREDAAGEAKRKLDDASDAGIPNRKWYEEVGDWFVDNWDTIVAVCKVVVAVLGIIALIIGGPILGAIVLIAALVVLADTLNKYMKGQASLWDVAFAALDCIPGMKGLTTLGGLAKGLKGLRTMNGLKAGLKGMAAGVRGLGKSARGALADGAKGAYNRLKNLVRSKGSDPIDMATGAMFLPETDVTLAGTLPLAFTRRAASNHRTGWWFGPTWSSTIDERLETDEHGVVWVTEDGLLLAYAHPTGPHGPVFPEAGPRLPLTRLDNGGYRIEDRLAGITRRFACPVDGIALLERISDRNGDTIDFDYSEDGTPLAIRHSGGYRLGLTVTDGRVTALHLSGAGENGADLVLRTYGYADDCLTTVGNAAGRAMQFGYDDRHRITSWTDRNGRSYFYTYDTADRCVAEGGEAGHISLVLDYDGTDAAWPDARITTVTTAEGAVSRFVVNGNSQIVAEIDPLGGTIRTTWDEHHHLTSWTDQLGHTTSRAYDDLGRLLVLTRPDGASVQVDYDAEGNPRTITRPDGHVESREFDARGNCVTIARPGGTTTRYAYDDAGHLSSVTDPTGLVTRVRCDAAGLAEHVTDPLGGVTRYAHDAFGRVATVTDPLGNTSRMQWGADGELLRRTAADGQTEVWTYDAEGNRVRHTDALGAETRFEYTHFNLLAARTGPDGVRHSFAYDPSLRLLGVSRPDGRSWSYRYDAAGRLLSETDFDGRTRSYGHDARGQVILRTNAAGQTVRIARDAFGRMVAKDADGAAGTYRYTYAYDLSGRLRAAEGPDAVVTLGRDPQGRLVRETVNGRSITFTHDAAGRTLSRTTPTGATSTWSYDGRGDLTRIHTAGRTLDFDHDAAGRLLSLGVGDALSLTSEYDGVGRVTSQAVAVDDGRTVRARSYRYRADGHLIGIEGPNGESRTFDLDAAGRTTAVRAENWTESYAYDDDGAQTTAAWPSRHPGQTSVGTRDYEGARLTRAGGTRYRYDDQGRLVHRHRTRLSRKAETWAYTWDAEDRLASVRTPDGTVWRYRYDPMGRRIAKQRMGADGTTVVEQTDFTWDGTTLCEQLTTDAAQAHTVALSWEHDGLRPVAQTERLLTASNEEIDARFFAMATDLVGSPTELLHEDGRVAWQGRSTLWGLTAWKSENSAYTPLRFPGQYYDPETGLHYNVHRYYDPETARYASPDPLGLGPSPNPFLYVLDPLLSADPLGLYEIGKPDPASQVGNLPMLADKIAAHGDIKNRGIPGIDDLDVPEHLEDLMTNSPGIRMRSTPSGNARFAWWDDATGTMLIREGDNGTFMQPDDGYEYFLKQLKE